MHIFKGFPALFLGLVLTALVAGCGGGGGGGSTAPLSSGAPSASGTTTASAGNEATPGSPADTSAAKVLNLEWNAYSNSDGTPLANLAGYKIYYGTSSREYPNVMTVDQSTNLDINVAGPGTYYFAITAFDSDGNESGFSDEVVGTVS